MNILCLVDVSEYYTRQISEKLIASAHLALQDQLSNLSVRYYISVTLLAIGKKPFSNQIVRQTEL